VRFFGCACSDRQVRTAQPLLQPTNCACSDSQLFIVTEFCGGALASLIAAHSANPPGHRHAIGAVPLPLFFKITSSIANGMAFLHSRDVVHRDLKPENVVSLNLSHPCTRATC
jgi:serine/threonine protein kinase